MLYSQEILLRLGSGQTVSDREFDRLYPPRIRKYARVHWTPIDIARRAAELLVTEEGARVLDVGSGSGKFCLIGAASTKGVFTGVERRARLVQTAQNLAAQFSWPRVGFLQGDALELDWNAYDGIYLFNPFAEHLFKSIQMDDEVETGLDPYEDSVRRTSEKLSTLESGKRVVLLNDFGAEMPEGFRLALEEPHGNETLRLWIKSGGSLTPKKSEHDSP